VRPVFQSYWSTILYASAKSVMFNAIDVKETVSLPSSTYIRIPVLVDFVAFRCSRIGRAFAS